MIFDGPGTEIPHSAVSTALMYIEGSFGALIMVLFLLSAILVATSGLWKIRARKLAIAEILLVLATVAFIVSGLSHSLAESIFPLFFIFLILVAVIIPLCAAALCWQKGFRRTAIAAIALVMLWLGVFTLRASISVFISDPAFDVCEGENGDCIS